MSSPTQSFLSPATKDAIKIAASVTISMGIAMAMGWEKPHWAAFAVAFTSLATEGQSINRSGERFFGTIVACLIAFLFLSWFPQDRWPFMVIVSIYVGICSYLMQGRRWNYFWYASGFICTVIVADSHDSASSFHIAVERTQETGLGILVHGVICALVWPVTTRANLMANSCRLFDTQSQLFEGYCKLRHGESEVKEYRKLRANVLQLLNQVEQDLEAAESDDYKVWESRTQWRDLVSISRSIAEEMGHWRTSFLDLADVDLERVIPNLKDVKTVIESRFESVADTVKGQNETPELHSPAVLLDESATESLSNMQRATLDAASKHLQKIEELTRELIECAQDIAGQPPENRASNHYKRPLLPAPYPDRLQGVGIVLTSFWLSFLLTIYVPDMPGEASFWQMSTLFAVLAVRTGAPPLHGIAIPVLIASIYGALMYIFIMPHLSGYLQLGTLLFVWTFIVAYMYSKPQQAGAKASMLANSISTLSIANEQTYSMAALANSLCMSVLLGVLLILSYYLFPSPRPEKIFLRHLRRFFRHAEELSRISRIQGTGPWSFVRRLRVRYLERDLISLPDSLAATAKKIDFESFPGSTPEALEDLVSSLYDFAFRLRDLIDDRDVIAGLANGSDLSAKIEKWKKEWESDLFEWNERDSMIESSEAMHAKLQRELSEFERLIAIEQSKTTQGKESIEDDRRLIGILGTYRRLVEAKLSFLGETEHINWAQLSESRF